MNRDTGSLIESMREASLLEALPTLNPAEEESLRLAAEAGDIAAMYWLGRLYLVQEYRVDEARALVRRAADAGYPAAIGLVASMTFWALPHRFEATLPPEVIDGWTLAADHGDCASQLSLAIHGDRAEEPLSSRRRLSRLKEATAGGYRRAFVTLGEWFYGGIVAAKDHEKAAHTFAQALKLGGTPGIEAIWLAFMSAEGQGMPKSMPSCLRYLDRYVEARTTDARTQRSSAGEACARLATLYTAWADGLSGTDKLLKGMYWFAQAARIADSDAVYRLIAMGRALLRLSDEAAHFEVQAFVGQHLAAEPPVPADWIPDSSLWEENLRITDQWLDWGRLTQSNG